MQFPFEVLNVLLKLVDALSEGENVVAGRVIYAFQHFGDTVSNLFAPVGTFAGL